MGWSWRPYWGISQSKEDFKWKSKFEKSSATKRWYRSCSTALRCGSFSEKSIEEKHLCRHDKNYYYSCKSNIHIINLIVGSRNVIKVDRSFKKKRVCENLDQQRESLLRNTDNLIFHRLVFFWNFNQISRTYNQINYTNL